MVFLFTLVLSNCQKDETISGYTDPDVVFTLIDVDDQPFNARATIQFPKMGRVTGNGPCNSYSAAQTAPLPWFKLGPMRTTKATCPDIDKERKFLTRLGEMSQIETLGNTVILRNEDGLEMVFRADQP